MSTRRSFSSVPFLQPADVHCAALGLLLTGSACRLADVNIDESSPGLDSETTTLSTGETDGDGDGDVDGDVDGDGDEASEPISVLLRVVTPDGTAIGKATITVDDTPHFTDNAGFLRLAGLQPESLVARIYAPGHTPAVVALELTEGLQVYREVHLFPLGPALTLDADAGGTVESDGITVDIPPRSLVNEFGEFVNGTVDITIVGFDPTSNDLAGLPGPLVAESTLGEAGRLLSLAMAEISVWQDGHALQLAPDSIAHISMQLPASLTNVQPGDEIPVWWLDLDAGIWREEGPGHVDVSTQDPDTLIWSADVDHFTWYNVDRFVRLPLLECYYVVVEDQQGQPLSRAFAITEPGGVFIDGGVTSASQTNVVSNCADAPLDTDVLLYVQGLEEISHAITQNTGIPNSCRSNGVPNPACTKITLVLPPESPPVICEAGDFMVCDYAGPPETEGVGICQTSHNYCIDAGLAWSGCGGQVTPTPESCATIFDDDCDADTLDPDAIDCECSVGQTIECYTGPMASNGVGLCASGTRTCNPILQEFGPCLDQVLPADEDCDSPADEDCDTLASCDPPLPPQLQFSVSQVKQFDFVWAPVPGAQFYRLFERIAPNQPFVQVGDDTTELGHSLTIALHERTSASYVLHACNVYGCTTSPPVDLAGDNLAGAIGYFKASNTDAGDAFSRVGLSGDCETLVVSARHEDSSASLIDGDESDNSMSDAGAAYAFHRIGPDSWIQEAYIKAPNPDANDQFGQSIAYSGDTLVVGAYRESSAATEIDGNGNDNSASNAGAAYVYDRDPMLGWQLQAYIKAPNAQALDAFGYTVDIGGDYLAVGARGEDGGFAGVGGDMSDNSLASTGAVYLYRRDDLDVWHFDAYVKASNPEPNDNFSYHFALSEDGRVLAVGAIGEDSASSGVNANGSDNMAPNSGAIYIYRRNDTDEWEFEAYIKPSNPGIADEFGISIDVAIGSGAYEYIVAVGATYDDGFDEMIPDSGAVYVYGDDGSQTWSELGYLKAATPGSNDEFGFDVELFPGGSTLAVAARYEGGDSIGFGGDPALEGAFNSGAVYLFEWDGAAWVETHYIKAPNTGSLDQFGSRLATCSDGSLAVGAWGEASSATGVAGDPYADTASDAGAAYLF